MTIVPHDPSSADPPPPGPAAGPTRPARATASARTVVRTLLGVLVVVGLPIAEITLLIVIGQHLGVLPTLGLLALEAVVGGVLAVRAGGRALRTLSEAVSTGRLPEGRMSDAALLGAGGLLLVVPGVLTDVVALAFVVPVTRPLVRRVFSAVFSRQVARAVGVRPDVLRARMDQGNTISGEVVDPPSETEAGPETELR